MCVNFPIFNTTLKCFQPNWHIILLTRLNISRNANQSMYTQMIIIMMLACCLCIIIKQLEYEYIVTNNHYIKTCIFTTNLCQRYKMVIKWWGMIIKKWKCVTCTHLIVLEVAEEKLIYWNMCTLENLLTKLKIEEKTKSFTITCLKLLFWNVMFVLS